jgi:hypothetical protein
MIAGKSRQSHCQRLNAAATSAVVRAYAPYVSGRSLGAQHFVGAALGCRAISPPDAGAEAQGAWVR